jgi:hypothetical protein
VGSLGALQVQQESGPFANSAITSAYDELGRLSQRTLASSTLAWWLPGLLEGSGRRIWKVESLR